MQSVALGERVVPHRGSVLAHTSIVSSSAVCLLHVRRYGLTLLKLLVAVIAADVVTGAGATWPRLSGLLHAFWFLVVVASCAVPRILILFLSGLIGALRRRL